MLLRRTLQASIFKWQNFSTSNAVLSKAKKPSPLAELRKKSGYSLTLCKDALAKNENDVARAFQWLDVSCMVRSNLKKSEWLAKNTITPSKYTLKRPKICIMNSPPVKPLFIKFSKNVSYEVNLTSQRSHLNALLLSKSWA